MDFLTSIIQTTNPNLFILGCLSIAFGFYMAWTIGTNDVANSMGTSVGSKTLNYRQAVLIAGIANFIGASFAGGNVTETIRTGIVNTELFTQEPNLLILGMVATLLGTALWLHLASFLELPVSTTHSIVGAIIGFALIVYGINSVNWVKVIQIVLSWLISPIGGGVLAYLIFRFIRNVILNVRDPGERIALFAPIFGALTIWIIVLAAIWRGLKNLQIHLTSLELILVSIVAAIVGYMILYIVVRNLKRKNIESITRVERIFMMLQVFTATYVAFSIGSNDVANAIGPLAAVLAIIKNGIVELRVPVPFWILVLGGLGISLGLIMYGWKVMKTIGTKITEITPTRGFAAEFSAATVVTFCSHLGMPVSTTHTIVGAVLGVGLAQGFETVNLKIIRTIIYSWLMTLPITAGISILLFYIFRFIFSM